MLDGEKGSFHFAPGIDDDGETYRIRKFHSGGSAGNDLHLNAGIDGKQGRY